jgi:NADH:ubiquinone oxidoreductase subunit D
MTRLASYNDMEEAMKIMRKRIEELETENYKKTGEVEYFIRAYKKSEEWEDLLEELKKKNKIINVLNEKIRNLTNLQKGDTINFYCGDCGSFNLEIE